jgi:hypothetical protein
VVNFVVGQFEIWFTLRQAVQDGMKDYYLRKSTLNALVTHEACGAAMARHISPGAQGRVDPRLTVPAAMRGMDPPDLGQQGAIGRLARTFGPATPGIIPRRRDAHHIAHDANWEQLALVRDEALIVAPQTDVFSGQIRVLAGFGP